jgi:hypothetical protein
MVAPRTIRSISSTMRRRWPGRLEGIDALILDFSPEPFGERRAVHHVDGPPDDRPQDALKLPEGRQPDIDVRVQLTRTSRSLSGRSSPRANEPKIATCRTPSRLIVARLARSRCRASSSVLTRSGRSRASKPLASFADAQT